MMKKYYKENEDGILLLNSIMAMVLIAVLVAILQTAYTNIKASRQMQLHVTAEFLAKERMDNLCMDEVKLLGEQDEERNGYHFHIKSSQENGSEPGSYLYTVSVTGTGMDEVLLKRCVYGDI